MHGLFVTGTDTNVGKTYIATLLARELITRDCKVTPRKPVESGCLNQQGELIPADALALKQASNFRGDLNEICPYRFEAAVSPVRAARLQNQQLSIEQLAEACKTNNDKSFLLVEGAGGFYSPLADNGLNADLATALQLPVLLVAEDRLGCLNQILLTAEAIAHRGLNLAAIVLNQKSTDIDNNMNNAEDLGEHIDVPIYIFVHTQVNAQTLKALGDYLQAL